MKASLLLAPVLLGGLALVGPASTNNRIAEAPDLNIPIVHGAPARPDVESAVRTWRVAHRRAQASGRAEDLVEVGDLYRRLGEITGAPARFDAEARAIYTRALSRARRQESLDGLLRVAEAFAALGDRQAVERAVGIAMTLAAHDPEARADVRAFATRIAADMAQDATHPER